MIKKIKIFSLFLLWSLLASPSQKLTPSVDDICWTFRGACERNDKGACLKILEDQKEFFKNHPKNQVAHTLLLQGLFLLGNKTTVRTVIKKLLDAPLDEKFKNMFVAAARGDIRLTKLRSKKCAVFDKSAMDLALMVAIRYGQFELVKALLEEGTFKYDKNAYDLILIARAFQQTAIEEYLKSFFEKKVTLENITIHFFKRLLQLRFVLANFAFQIPLLTVLPETPIDKLILTVAMAYDFIKNPNVGAIISSLFNQSATFYIPATFWNYAQQCVNAYDKTPYNKIDTIIDLASFPQTPSALSVLGAIVNSKYGKLLTLRPLDS